MEQVLTIFTNEVPLCLAKLFRLDAGETILAITGSCYSIQFPLIKNLVLSLFHLLETVSLSSTPDILLPLLLLSS